MAARQPCESASASLLQTCHGTVSCEDQKLDLPSVTAGTRVGSLLLNNSKLSVLDHAGVLKRCFKRRKC